MKLMPQEIEVWYILPAIRKEIAIEMKKLGLKQNEIAQKLGLTEAAVSQYLKGKRGNDVDLDKEIKTRIKEITKKLIKDQTCLIKEINELCKRAKKCLLLCKVHRKHDHGLSKDCSACLEQY